MYLHNDRELFLDVITEAAAMLEIDPSIVEKDYYVTSFLREIVNRQPDIIFKGGTSLSKCYKLINRFSEDIDLNIRSDIKPTEGQRKRLKASIVSVIDSFGLELTNPEDIRSRRDFNRYVIDYPTLFSAAYLKQQLIVETAVFMRSYPSRRLAATSYVYDFLNENGHKDIIEEYELAPFDLNVQAAERTLLDKLYALGDYYLTRMITGHSRHIYDIYKLLGIVELNDELKWLNIAVREERRCDKFCASAKDDVDFRALLNDIIEKEIYRADYENITASLLFDNVSYDTAIQALKAILEFNLFY